MEINKKFWCYTCNSECQINIVNKEGEEEYQCSKCKNTFIEEISNEDKPQNFHIEQSQTSSNSTNNQINNSSYNPSNLIPQNINGPNSFINNIRININTLSSLNIENNNNSTNSQNQPQDEYGMDGTLLFLPSTVNYVLNNNRLGRNILNSDLGSFGEIVTEIVGPNGHNIFMSRNLINGNRPILGFLSNHNNDNQFENFLNIIMSFDSSHKGNPPASENAIKNLKKIEINKDNIKNFNEETCNVCLENYVEGQTSIKIECGHNFHDNCIIKWLKMRNTCPVCRHELESNDPNYEKRKHSHRETLRNFHNNFGNNDNNEPEASA